MAANFITAPLGKPVAHRSNDYQFRYPRRSDQPKTANWTIVPGPLWIIRVLHQRLDERNAE
jgi:hypothetical protein